MTVLKVCLPPKTRKPAGLGGLFSLYFYFNNLAGNTMPNSRSYFLFGMCGLEDFFRSWGLTRFSGETVAPYISFFQ